MIFNIGGGARKSANFVFTPNGGSDIEITPITGSFSNEFCRYIKDGTDWRFEALVSGDINFTAPLFIDFFLCGGGGNGGETAYTTWYFPSADPAEGYRRVRGGSGGGGGYRKTKYNYFANGSKPIAIGEAGESTSAFGETANGGSNGGNGTDHEVPGGTGGSAGGAGSIAYSASTASKFNGDDGEYPFGDTTLSKYGAGGGGTSEEFQSYYGYPAKHVGSGGADGAGGEDEKNALPNSGGGGAAAFYNQGKGSGGSGIVIIRNHRS